MTPRYHFVTEMTISAPVESVWKALQHSEDWPEWWRWLIEASVLAEGDDDGVGRRVRNRVGTPFGYRLTYDGVVTMLVEHRRIDFDAVGDLEGHGQFLMSEPAEAETRIVFNWLVQTTKWWMNLLVPFARRLFAWNHNRLMTDFANGLAKTTGGELKSVENRTLAPAAPGFFEMPSA